MGVVNVTPDSFSDGGLYARSSAAISHGRALFAAGADIVDVGGESTRPGATGVTADEELERVRSVVADLAVIGPVSIDSSKAQVAAAAIACGAEVVNDVTALGDPLMADVVAAGDAGLVLMHMQGTPRTMQEAPRYNDVVSEVLEFLLERAATAEAAGIDRARIAIDPGIGFGKDLGHNLELLANLGRFVATGYPVVLGTSRKRFLQALTGAEVAAERDPATAATIALAVASGVAVIRVHNVVMGLQVARTATAIVQG